MQWTQEHSLLARQRIGAVAARLEGVDSLGHEADPLEDGLDTLLVVINGFVGDIVGVHDLGSNELVLGRVNLAAEKLVEGTESREEHGPILPTLRNLTDVDSTLG